MLLKVFSDNFINIVISMKKMLLKVFSKICINIIINMKKILKIFNNMDI